MTRAPKPLSDAALALLRDLAGAHWRRRLNRTPERDALKRRGLIDSSPLNPPGHLAVAGHGSRWGITKAGREHLAEIDGAKP